MPILAICTILFTPLVLLVDRQGKVITRRGTTTPPHDPKLLQTFEKVLATNP